METKICVRCNEEKNISEFRFSKTIKHFSSYCKKCEYLNTKEWKILNPKRYAESHKKSQKKWTTNNKEHLQNYYKNKKRNLIKEREYAKRYSKKHPERVKEKDKKKRQNMTQSYIATLLKITVKDLKNNPELMECKKMQITIYREIEQLVNQTNN
jgi:hypothetical protein